jgi:hypothetical protein
MTPRDGESSPVRLQRLIAGYRMTQALGVVAQLGIADLLANGPRTCDELARLKGCNSAALYRVLRLLAGEGVFTEIEPQRFDLTPMARLLQTGTPGSMRGRALLEAREWSAAWSELAFSIATGGPAFDRVFGEAPFEYYARRPPAAALFNEAMTSIVAQAAQAVARAYDFSLIDRIVDVAGGHGALLAAILQANLELRGVLIDLPEMVDGARAQLNSAGVLDRAELVAGDPFAAVPHGNACVIAVIMRDWDDERLQTIIRNCRTAMSPSGRLLLVCLSLPTGDDPSYSRSSDVNLLVLLGGRERTEAEYRALLASSGFTLARIVPTSSDYSILEGLPV